MTAIIRPASLKSLPYAINAAIKRRAEEQLYQAYTTTLLQYIMEHKHPEDPDELPLYVEALKQIYPDNQPKEKKQTAAEIIEQTRRNIRKN